MRKKNKVPLFADKTRIPVKRLKDCHKTVKASSLNTTTIEYFPIFGSFVNIRINLWNNKRKAF
jgi:hypothetical protein